MWFINTCQFRLKLKGSCVIIR